MWKIFSEQSSSFYLDILPEILKEYNNDYHNSIKMTPIQASKKKMKIEFILIFMGTSNK